MAVFLAAYDIPVSFDTLMRLAGGNSIANVTSVTPGGAGVNQAFNVASLNGITNATTATAYSVAQQLVTTAWNILFAIVAGGLGLRLDRRQGARGELLRRREGQGRRAEGRPRRAERGQAGGEACVSRRSRPLGWIDAELALTALAAMLSPTTLTFSVLVARPRRPAAPDGALVLPRRARRDARDRDRRRLRARECGRLATRRARRRPGSRSWMWCSRSACSCWSSWCCGGPPTRRGPRA